jgi:6-phosphofructokinase 1
MHNIKPEDLKITRLGIAEINSPLNHCSFIPENSRILYSAKPEALEDELKKFSSYIAFEHAGSKAKIFHNPKTSKAAIITAGGLCPGLNNVIKDLVGTLMESYGIPEVLGIRYGYRGLAPQYKLKPVQLTPENVDDIHTDGGTILGSSRGNQDIGVMVDSLVHLGINILFCVGGDGTLKGANKIAEECLKRNLKISVIGVPKTIDNDISLTQRTFGFETAIYETHTVITAAHNEAKGVYNGIGLIHVMGRDSGFIATFASLANSVVNYCFIPEVPFELDGPNGFLETLKKRLEVKQHAVIVLAEGAGQYFFAGNKQQKDASGNLKNNNIGEFLRDKILAFASQNNFEVNMKYFDPSYSIRSVPARGTDAVFCLLFAQNAVHSAMQGCTDTMIGVWHQEFTLVPMKLATSERKKIDPNHSIWQSVLQLTHQPDFIN